MAKILTKLKAQQLRRQGKTVTYIASLLSVSKGTVSFWCRDIALTTKQLRKIQQESKSKSVFALLKSSEKKRDERMRRTLETSKLGAKDVGSLSERDIFILGIGLYWGEGYKNGNEEFGITNSDPDMMRFLIKWLKITYEISTDQLIARVSINELHKKRVSTVLEYWSKNTEIPVSQFTKTSLILIKTSTKKVYTNIDEHFGTLRIKVRRGSFLRRRILGSIEEIKQPTQP